MAKNEPGWRTPEFMAKIGALGGKAMAKKRGSKWMSMIAKRSHRNRQPDDYVGGRPTLEEQAKKSLKK
jgi:hypothetical protein